MIEYYLSQGIFEDGFSNFLQSILLEYRQFVGLAFGIPIILIMISIIERIGNPDYVWKKKKKVRR